MLSIALALIVSQNPWQWANDPKYYLGPVIDYCRSGSNCGFRTLTVGAGANTVFLGLTTDNGGTTLPGFKYDIGTTRLGIFNANNSTSFTLNLGTGLSVATGSIQIPTASYIYFYGGVGAGITGTAEGIGVVGTTLYSNNTSGLIRMYSTTNSDGFPTPATAGRSFAVGTSAGELQYSNGDSYKKLQSGNHPLLDRMTYVKGWKDATPQFEGDGMINESFTAPTLADACIGGTVANVASMPLPDNLLGTGRIGFGKQFTTSAVLNAICNDSTTAFTKWNNSQPHECFYWRSDTVITNTRAVVGMGVITLFTAPSDTPTTEGAWFRYSTVAGDTNWMACNSNGVSAANCISTGVAMASNTTYLMCIDGTLNSVVTFNINGRTRARKTSNIPSTTAIGEGAAIQATTASARSFTISRRVFEMTR